MHERAAAAPEALENLDFGLCQPGATECRNLRPLRLPEAGPAGAALQSSLPAITLPLLGQGRSTCASHRTIWQRRLAEPNHLDFFYLPRASSCSICSTGVKSEEVARGCFSMTDPGPRFLQAHFRWSCCIKRVAARCRCFSKGARRVAIIRLQVWQLQNILQVYLTVRRLMERCRTEGVLYFTAAGPVLDTQRRSLCRLAASHASHPSASATFLLWACRHDSSLCISILRCCSASTSLKLQLSYLVKLNLKAFTQRSSNLASVTNPGCQRKLVIFKDLCISWLFHKSSDFHFIERLTHAPSLQNSCLTAFVLLAAGAHRLSQLSVWSLLYIFEAMLAALEEGTRVARVLSSDTHTITQKLPLVTIPCLNVRPSPGLRHMQELVGLTASRILLSATDEGTTWNSWEGSRKDVSQSRTGFAALQALQSQGPVQNGFWIC